MSSTRFTRRRLLRGSAVGIALAGRVLSAASEFWNEKQPAEWSPEEIGKLLTRSPWAKEVNIGMSPEPSRPAVGGRESGIGGGGEYGSRGARPNPAATVRWESAAPILAATKEVLPREFAGHYVIAVAGLPVQWGLERSRRGAESNGGETRVSDFIERLQAGATLEAKGKDGEGAGIVRRAASDEAWLFGFSKELLPVTIHDSEVVFALKAGPMAIRAKFTPKTMIYRGQLAV